MKQTWYGRPTHWTRAGHYIGCLIVSALGMAILLGAFNPLFEPLPITAAIVGYLPWLGWALFVIGFVLLLHFGINVWFTRYEVTPDYIRLRRNYLLGRRDVIRMNRVKDVQASVPLHYRLLSLLMPSAKRNGRLGSVRIISLDHTDSDLTMAGIHDPMGVKELLLVHQQTAVDRYGTGLIDVGPRG